MKGRKIRLITEILALITICLISFLGVYTQKGNVMQNEVKQYNLSKDLKGYRELMIKVSDATEVTDSEGKTIGNTDNYSDEEIQKNTYTKTENKVNKEEDLKEENFKTAKTVIEKRLKSFGVKDFNLSQNLETGLIYLTIPEDSSTDHTISNLIQVGEFKIKDSKNESKVFITNNEIKKATVGYNTTTTGTTVYLQIELNKNGQQILKDISSGEYAKKDEAEDTSEEEHIDETEQNEAEENKQAENTSEQEANNEETEEKNEEEKTQKEIVLAIDNNSVITTSFEEPIENGVISISMGAATKDTKRLSDNMQSASTIATTLNSGKIPVTYKITGNRYVNTDISKDYIKYAIYGCIAIAVLGVLYLIIRFKVKGIIASIAFAGYIGLYLLLVRYANVPVAIESIVGTALTAIISYIVIFNMLKISKQNSENKNEIYKKEFISTIIKIIPLVIATVVFSFTRWDKIAIFGMFVFWGILLNIIYNFIITRDMIN